MTDQQAIRLGARVDTLMREAQLAYRLAAELEESVALAGRAPVLTPAELDDFKVAQRLRAAATELERIARRVRP